MPFGHPPGTDPQKFHLIAPYQHDPREWTKMEWIDQYSNQGKTYRITTIGQPGTRNTARVKTYGDVLQEYNFTRNQSARTPKETHAVDKRLVCWNGVTSGSRGSSTSVKNPTPWKWLQRDYVTRSRTFIRNIPTHDGMSGKRKYCRSVRMLHC